MAFAQGFRPVENRSPHLKDQAMKRYLLRTTFLTTAALAALALGATTASAQMFIRPMTAVRPLPGRTIPPTIVSGVAFPNTYNYVNPNPYIAPGVKLNQWAYNSTVVGRTYAQFPPWLY